MKLVELTSKAPKKRPALTPDADEENQNRRQQTEATAEASDAEAESGSQTENGSSGGSSLTLGGDDNNGGGDDTTISTGSDWAMSSQSQHHRRLQLGPGAWHVLPRTNLVRHSWTDAAMTTTAEPDPGLTTTTHQIDAGSSSAGGGDDVVHIVTATLVQDNEDDDSGETPTNESALSSTLVTHAMSDQQVHLALSWIQPDQQ